jgi:hypothetical protein
MLPKLRFFPKLWIWFLFFCGRTMAMAAMKVVSAGGYRGWATRKKKYPQGAAGPVFEETPVFGVQLPKLDQLMVRYWCEITINTVSRLHYGYRRTRRCPDFELCIVKERYALEQNTTPVLPNSDHDLAPSRTLVLLTLDQLPGFRRTARSFSCYHFAEHPYAMNLTILETWSDLNLKCLPSLQSSVQDNRKITSAVGDDVENSRDKIPDFSLLACTLR